MPDNDSYDTVVYDVADGVATITLNRPDAMNSLTAEVKVGLRAALERAREDPTVRAVVLTGAGRAFSAGQDLREHSANLEGGRGLDGTVRDHYNPLVLTIARMAKPVVAAVNGTAAGAGAALAFACDLRVAADDASFLMAFARVGLGPDTGASWTLQRLVGRTFASELLLLAEPVDATRAVEIGLVNRAVPAGEVAGTAHAIAARLAAGPTVAYGAIKSCLDYAATHDLAESLENEASAQDSCAATTDHHNATRAFVGKQRPVFEGK